MGGGWKRWNQMGVKTAMKQFADNVKSNLVVAERVGAHHVKPRQHSLSSGGAGSEEADVVFVTVPGNEGRGLYLKEIERKTEASSGNPMKSTKDDESARVVKRQLFPEHVEKTEIRREVRNKLKLRNKRLRREAKPILNPFLDEEQLGRKRGLCLPKSLDKKAPPSVIRPPQPHNSNQLLGQSRAKQSPGDKSKPSLLSLLKPPDDISSPAVISSKVYPRRSPTKRPIKTTSLTKTMSPSTLVSGWLQNQRKLHQASGPSKSRCFKPGLSKGKSITLDENTQSWDSRTSKQSPNFHSTFNKGLVSSSWSQVVPSNNPLAKDLMVKHYHSQSSNLQKKSSSNLIVHSSENVLDDKPPNKMKSKYEILEILERANNIDRHKDTRNLLIQDSKNPKTFNSSEFYSCAEEIESQGFRFK